MSSSPETCIRSSSRPDAIRSATRLANRTGVITCRVTIEHDFDPATLCGRLCAAIEETMIQAGAGRLAG